MAYFVRITLPRNQVQALYDWLDQFCPSWEFENSYHNHAEIRAKNEEALRHFAANQTPNGPAQLKPTPTGFRVQTEREAMACKIHYLECLVEPRGI